MEKASGIEIAGSAALELRRRDEEIGRLTRELLETNSGVVALYAELDDKNTQLRHASELKSRFLAYLSHEFRSPLSSIRGISRILLDELDGTLSHEQRRQVQLVRTQAEEMSEMVDDLLDLAKIEAGRITISPAWFDMVDLFAALRGMFHPIAASRSVALVFEEPPETIRIFTDDAKLSQILRNFISNALKFTSAGEVRIRALRLPGERICFSVSDTGIGIPPEFHETIFEEFTQVDSPLHRRLRGSGLGLSLARKFAALLHGEVSMQSVPERGSVFAVTIPIRLDQAAPPLPSLGRN